MCPGTFQSAQCSKAIITSFLVVCLAAFASRAGAGCPEVDILEVIDGCTLRVTGRTAPHLVSLYGIDVDGPGQAWGKRAHDALRSMVLNRRVTLCLKQDSGMSACEVYVREGYMCNVNHEMVRRGLARATAAEYKSLESLARKNLRGLWSGEEQVQPGATSPGGTPVPSTGDREAVQGPGAFDTVAPGRLSVYEVSRVPQPGNAAAGDDQCKAEQRRQELEALRAKRRQRSSTDEPGLLDIDHIDIRTRFYEPYDRPEGVVEISLEYKNDEQGAPVFWTAGEVNCECRVIGHFSDGTNTRIARKTAVVSSYRERIYIDIPATYLDPYDFIVLNSCTVECELTSGIFSLEATDKVYVYFTWTPWRRHRHYH